MASGSTTTSSSLSQGRIAPAPTPSTNTTMRGDGTITQLALDNAFAAKLSPDDMDDETLERLLEEKKRKFMVKYNELCWLLQLYNRIDENPAEMRALTEQARLPYQALQYVRMLERALATEVNGASERQMRDPAYVGIEAYCRRNDMETPAEVAERKKVRNFPLQFLILAVMKTGEAALREFGSTADVLGGGGSGSGGGQQEQETGEAGGDEMEVDDDGESAGDEDEEMESEYESEEYESEDEMVDDE